MISALSALAVLPCMTRFHGLSQGLTEVSSFLTVLQFFLCWTLLFIMLVKTYIDVQFQWKTPSDLLEIAKKFTAEYNILVTTF